MKVLCQYGMGMGDVGSCLYNDGCYDLFVLNGRKFVFGTLKASLSYDGCALLGETT